MAQMRKNAPRRSVWRIFLRQCEFAVATDGILEEEEKHGDDGDGANVEVDVEAPAPGDTVSEDTSHDRPYYTGNTEHR